MPTIEVSESTMKLIEELEMHLKDVAETAGARWHGSLEGAILNAVTFRLNAFEDRKLHQMVSGYFKTEEGIRSVQEFRNRHHLQ